MRYRVMVLRGTQPYKCIIESKSVKTCEAAYTKEMEGSRDVLFERKFLRQKPVHYHLCLCTDSRNKKLRSVGYLRDDLGRLVPVEMEGWTVLRMEPFRVREKISDYFAKKLITFETMVKRIVRLPHASVGFVFNKIVVDDGDTLLIFSLKNAHDAERCYNLLREIIGGKLIFFGRIAKSNRRWVYNRLREKGVNVNYFYKVATKT